jgi:hypothetical protein
VPLRIAFDMDGVLADMDGELARHADTLFGTARAPSTIDAGPPSGVDETLAALNLSPRQTQNLWRHVQSIENFWQTLREIEPDVIRRLGTIAAEQRWEVLFLTKRPGTAGGTAQLQSQRWLQAKGFPLPSVYVVQGSRGKIAAALDLDVVVDDRAENCLDVVLESKARAILVWRDRAKTPPATAQKLGIPVVQSVSECLDRLTKVDVAAGQPGFMSRLLRALGLKESAGPA